MSNIINKSETLFKEGYNCCQAVIKATYDNDKAEILTRMASSFGGGIAGQRQVCGAAAAIAMVLGEKYGSTNAGVSADKMAHKLLVNDACKQFENTAGSIVCGELLGLPGFKKLDQTKKMPCHELVKLATKIIDQTEPPETFK